MRRYHASPPQTRRLLRVSISIAFLALLLGACGTGPSTRTPAATASSTPILAPALAQETVYFADFQGWVYAFNARDGSPRWKVSVATMYGSPAVAAGVVYVVDRGGQVYALSASSGKTLWSYPRRPNGGDGEPIVVNGVLYIGTDDGSVYALSASSGKLLWRFDALGTPGARVPDSGHRQRSGLPGHQRHR